ncbi:MAG: hypothetical protein ACPGUY_07625 [Akkermansiaceae bacterium]
MFAPKWKKEAKLLDKAAKKFLNYKRDLLDEQQIAEIESRRSDLSKFKQHAKTLYPATRRRVLLRKTLK